MLDVLASVCDLHGSVFRRHRAGPSEQSEREGREPAAARSPPPRGATGDARWSETLQTLPADPAPGSAEVAATSGFSLHAGVAAKVSERGKLSSRNAEIEAENARIRAIREEAERLEKELGRLEEPAGR